MKIQQIEETDEDILRNYRKRLELRNKLRELVRDYLTDVIPADMISELESIKLHYSTFVANRTWDILEKGGQG